jgi:uncharacterized protein YukE
MAFALGKEAAKNLASGSFTPAELDQMRSMLDDPNVAQDSRRNFLYALSNAGRVNDADIDKYASRVGADAGDIKSGGQDVLQNLKNAKDSIPGARQDQANGGVRNAQAALGQGGYANSNEIVDQGEKGLKLFEEFYPLYQQAGGQYGGAGTAAAAKSQRPAATSAASSNTGSSPGVYSHTGVDPVSLRAGMDEFRDIDFAAFAADAQTLKTANATVAESADALSKAWNANTAEWQGDAKSAAQERNNGLVKAAGTISQAMRTGSDDITFTVNNGVRENVVRFCNEVLGIYGDGKIADMTVVEVQGALQIQREFPQFVRMIDDKIKELDDLSWVEKAANKIVEFTGFVVGGPIMYFAAKQAIKLVPINSDNIKEMREKVQQVLDDANGRLQAFVQDYTVKANSVHEQASTYVSGIQANYDDLIQALGKGLDPDPFATADEGGGQVKPASHAGGGHQGGGPTGGGNAGGGVTPPVPPPTVEATTKPAEGMNPITGKPLEVDPETGKPFPIDPKTGEAFNGLGDHQGRVRVQQGDHTIAMSEPDKTGKMDVSVDDGTGHQKDYKLAFDDVKGDVNADGKFDPVTAGKDGDFGPPGAQKEGAPGADGVFKPDADGKIHIQDGNLKIIAERPDGPDGATVVTVDDGKGEPAKYTLDAKDSDESDSNGGDVKLSDEPTTSDARASRPDAGGFAAPSGRNLDGDVSASAVQGATAGDPAVAGVGDPVAGVTSETTVAAGAESFFSSPGDGAVTGGLGDLLFDSGAPADSDSVHPVSADGDLGMAPGGMDPNGAQQAGSGGLGGMMGGLGSAPGGGGDQQRSSGQYRVEEGGLFETSGARSRISGSLDDDGDRPTGFDR